MGTISSFLSKRSDLLPLLQALERFDTCGEFLLTELGHGLDVRNIETTATHQVDGSFVLHTPNPRAAKTMPQSSPHAGMARTAVVFARLLVAGQAVVSNADDAPDQIWKTSQIGQTYPRAPEDD